jgi:hypothetical protein
LNSKEKLKKLKPEKQKREILIKPTNLKLKIESEKQNVKNWNAIRNLKSFIENKKMNN